MPKKRIGFVVLSLVVGLGFTACSDDEGGGAGAPTEDEGLAVSMVDEVVLPLIQTLSLNSYVNLIGGPAPVLPDQCEPLSICSSGSAEYCPNSNGYTVNFSTCATAGDVLDGTINLVGTAEGGSGTVELLIGDTSISGDISYSIDVEECFNQTFDAVVVDLAGMILNITGFMQFCQPPVVVNDRVAPTWMDFFITIPARGKYVTVTEFNDGAGTMQVAVWNTGDQAPVVVCDGVIYSHLNCYTDLYE